MLEVRENNGVLELRPAPRLENQMKKHWDYFRANNPDYTPPSGKELEQLIHDEVRDTYADHLQKNTAANRPWYI